MMQDASTAPAGLHASMHNASRTGCEHFPKPVPIVLPMSRLSELKPSWQGHLVESVSDLMRHQYRLSVLQWNPCPTRKNPTQILPAACGRFQAVILQEAGITRRMFRSSSSRTPTATTSPSCSTRTRSDLLRSSPSPRPPQAKTHGGIFALVVRGLPRRPSIADSPTVTFCSVHIHEKVATKRDASASTVGDVFSDPEFMAPGSGHWWPGQIMPKRPYAWRVNAHGCCKFDNADLVLHLVTSLRISLSSFISASPTSWAPTASCAVLKLSNVAWSVQRPKNGHMRLRK